MLLGEDDTLMSEGTLFSRLFNERSPFCAYDEKAESSSLSTMSDCKQQYASTGSYREQKTDIRTTWPNTSEHVGPTIQIRSNCSFSFTELQMRFVCLCLQGGVPSTYI